MRGNYLKDRDGDRINAVLAAAGYNFSLLLRWFEELLRVLLLIICRSRAQLMLGLAWLGLAWLGLAWLGLAWLGLAWLGLAWLGLAWLGLAWLGLAWLG